MSCVMIASGFKKGSSEELVGRSRHLRVSMEDPEPLRTQNNKALAVVIGEASFQSMVRLRRPFIHRGHPWVSPDG